MNITKNDPNQKEEVQPMMILTIEVGNGNLDKLQLYDLNNIEQETYDFCLKNKLDFTTMQEIITQIKSVIKDKQLQEDQEENENEIQEIKEEDERNTENNNQEENQESVIVSNETKNCSSKENKKILSENNDNNNNKLIQKQNKVLQKVDISNNNNINKLENNFIYNNKSKNKNIPSNCTNSSVSSGIFTKSSKRGQSKTKKNKTIKENIKNAIAMAKEQTKGYINEKIKAERMQNSKKLNKNHSTENSQFKMINSDLTKNEHEKNITTEETNINQNESPIPFNPNNKINKEQSNENLISQKIDNQNENENENENDNENDNENENMNDNNITNEINNNNDLNKSNNIKINQSSNTINNLSKYNPGKELYERGMKFKEEEKEKLEALRRNLEVDELEDNTFQPKINKISQMQNDNRRERKMECSNPDVIANYKQYKENKMEYLKQKIDKDFDKIYTFKPNINRNHSSCSSKKNNLNENLTNTKRSKSRISNRYEKLYNYRFDYKEKEDRLKQKIFNEYPFKPQINENSMFLKLNIPFNERLEAYSNKTKENLMRIQQIYEREQGYYESFKPKINNKKNKELLKTVDEFFINEFQQQIMNEYPEIENEKKNMIIDPYTKLYLYSKKYEQDKTLLAEKYYESQKRTPEFNQMTEEIYNKKKEKSFKQIFKLLDIDEDGKISGTHLNIFKLPKQIQKILEPVFCELKEEKETLNEFEFIFVCEQLYQSLPWNEKRLLSMFEDYEKKNQKKEKLYKEVNKFSFKPKINKRNNSFDKPIRIIGKNNTYHRNKDINEESTTTNIHNENLSITQNYFKNENFSFIEKQSNLRKIEEKKNSRQSSGKKIDYNNFISVGLNKK